MNVIKSDTPTDVASRLTTQALELQRAWVILQALGAEPGPQPLEFIMPRGTTSTGRLPTKPQLQVLPKK